MKLLNRPNDTILIWQIRHIPHRTFEARTIDIGRNRNANLHIVRHRSRFELTTSLDHVLNSRSTMRLHHRLYPNQRLDVRIQPVRHEIKLSIRRNETNGAIVLKPGKPHTLMELDILQLHRLSRTILICSPRRLKHDFIIQPQLQLGHTRQKRLHLDSSINLTVKHCSIRSHQQIQLLHDIQKDFILLMLNTLGTPRNCIRQCHGWFIL
mmetsp:Transcript_14532/g.31314  ORF Transcript_14532/g.31314 Transcript_14532/m.31314 type:complete len:209 (-) Transcript_14532:318-944(-)